MGNTNEFDDIAGDYSELVETGMVLKGSDHEYFNQYKLFYLEPYMKKLHGEFKLLDYGCGVGLLSRTIQSRFPRAAIHGFDVSAESIDNVDLELRNKSQNRFCSNLEDLDEDYDIAILSTVLHHVPISERMDVIGNIYKRLKKYGLLIVFEHNMKNPLTRKSVAACPFDNEAVMLTLSECEKLLKGMFSSINSKYVTFFPEQLRKLWFIDKYIGWLPMGAQYMIVAAK